MNVLQNTNDTITSRMIELYHRQPTGDFLTLLTPKETGEYFSRETLSYRDLLRRACGWGELYREYGANPGQRIIIILRHQKDLYAAYAGALLYGFVPAYFAFPSEKISQTDYVSTVTKLVEQADPALIVTTSDIMSSIQDGVRKATSLKRVIAADGNLQLKEHEDFLTIAAVSPDTTAFLQYSSGTTGLKKGVAITHQALLWQVDAYARTLEISSETDRIVSWLPLYHDMGLIACFLMPLVKGLPIISMSALDWVRRPGMLLKAITDFQGTLCWLPNFAYNFLTKNIQSRELEKVNLCSVRQFINCSEPVLPSSHGLFYERFKGYGLSQAALGACYALAENTFAVSSTRSGETSSEDIVDENVFLTQHKAIPVSGGKKGKKFLSSGNLLPETQVRIVDEQGNEVLDRTVGEILIQSPSLFKEYFKNEKATRNCFKNGWYITGDLGYKIGDALYVVGRKKDVIIVAGRNIYPQDIESVVNEIPGVYPGRCVVFGMNNELKGTEELVILAETNEKDESKYESIRDSIFDKVAHSADVAASDVRLLPHMTLIKSTSGKISRVRNKSLYVETILAKTQTAAKKKALVQSRSMADSELLVKIRSCVSKTLSASADRSGFNDDDKLISSGRIDSLSLSVLISELESNLEMRFSQESLAMPENLDSVVNIAKTITRLQSQDLTSEKSDQSPNPVEEKDIVMNAPSLPGFRKSSGFWTFYYRLFFKLKRIRFGRGLKVWGPLVIRLDGKASNIELGDNVTLMPYVDLKVRENGKIKIGHNVFLDTMCRLVAANDATLKLGDGVTVGLCSNLVAGTDILIGYKTAIAGYCSIFSSQHTIYSGKTIFDQGYTYDPVYIQEGGWIAAYSFIHPGTRLGRGIVVAAHSNVSGQFPSNAVVAGNPARIIKYRQNSPSRQ